MIRLPRAWRLPLPLLATVVFVTSHYASSLGQSSETTTAPALDVLSAHYNRITDTINFRLVNNSQKAATAYYVAFGVMGEKQVNWKSGTGEDLLDLTLTSQCRYAGTGFPDGNDSWEGAIKPGDVYVHADRANLPKDQLSGVDPPVQVVVVGVIWSDGGVETPTVTGATRWVTSAINRRLEQRREDAQESSRVVSILNAHAEDADIQNRIGEATRSLQSLLDDYRRERQVEAPGQEIHVDSTFLVSRVLNNLNNFVASRTPKVFFDAYRAVFECQSKRRVAMLHAISPGRPER